MAETQTLARPYADAIFEVAQAKGQLAEWSDTLAALAAIVSNDDAAALMDNPAIADARLAEVIIEVAGSDLHDDGANLVRLLVENTRLSIAPEIAEQYEALKAEAENRLAVRITSAVALTDAQQQALGKALEARLARNVSLSFDQDDSVIGGAVIRAGDLVIDGSLRAQLERMRQSMAQ